MIVKKNGERIFRICIYCEIKANCFAERINVWYDVVFSKITLFSVSTTRKIELPLIEMKGNI